MKTINEKLAGPASERAKAIKNMSYEEAREIMVNRLKNPDKNEYNHTFDVFEQVVDVIYGGPVEEASNKKSTTTKKTGKEEKVSDKS